MNTEKWCAPTVTPHTVRMAPPAGVGPNVLEMLLIRRGRLVGQTIKVARPQLNFATASTSAAVAATQCSVRFQSSHVDPAVLASSPAPAVEIAKLVHAKGGALGLGKVINGVSAPTKQAIMTSGKGLEGFLRQFDYLFQVTILAGEKRLVLADPHLFGAPPLDKVKEAPQERPPTIAVAQKPDVLEMKSEPALTVDATAHANVAASTAEETAEAPDESQLSAQSLQEEEGTTSPSIDPNVQTDGATEAVHDDAQVAADSAPSGSETQQSASLASASTTTASASPAAGIADPELEEAMNRDPTDPNYETRRRVLQLMPREDTWYNANEMHMRLYKSSTAVPYQDFVLYLRGSPDYYFYHKGTVTRRLKRHGTTPPPKDPDLVVCRTNIKLGYIAEDGTPKPKDSVPAAQAATQAAAQSAVTVDTTTHANGAASTAAETAEAPDESQLSAQSLQEEEGTTSPSIDPNVQTDGATEAVHDDAQVAADSAPSGSETRQSASLESASTRTSSASPAAGIADPELEEAMNRDATDPNYETRRRVLQLMPREDTWYNANEMHTRLYKSSTAVPYQDFVLYLRGSPDYYFYHKGTVTRRLKRHGTTPPPKDPDLVVCRTNIKLGYIAEDGTPKPKDSVPAAQAAATQAAAQSGTGGPAAAGSESAKGAPATSTGPSSNPAAGGVSYDMPTQLNNWGGWGAAANVPTSADVFEILKYVPIHWMTLCSLTTPPDVKRRHIRVSSGLTWFARQPRYFDVRVLGGTIEVRRSVLLHPEAHGLTKEEAEAIVKKRIEADIEAGEPLPVKLAREAPKVAAKKSGGGGAVSATMPSSGGGQTSASTDTISKILLRVCPGYFITTQSIIRRATKKLDVPDILQCAMLNQQNLDVISVTSATNRTVSCSFLRRKTGVEASKWEADFTAELTNSSNLDLLCTCMSRVCAQWDRLHFVYVRLPDEDKVAIGGFDGMCEFLRAHPHVFAVGEYFVKRVDSSDPSFDATEPTSNEVTSTKQLEDNPYHLSRELALVFQYLVPEDQPCSMSHFVECCSPAMKSVLPPRLITIVQSHPELLSYREISPGTYAVSRATDADEAASSLTEEETLQEVLKLVPPRGIDASHLMSSFPPPLHAAVVNNYGKEGIHELVNRNLGLFHVVRTPPYVTLFLKKPRRPEGL
jgi:hypothetical protein